MRPLLISDCDEVLLLFAQPFAQYLDRDHGITLTMDSFALSGNARRGGVPIDAAEFPGLLTGFFAGAQGTQPAVPGAVDALHRLSAVADIVVLTNIDQEHHGARRDVLDALGLPYPLQCNGGGKGRPVAELAAGRPAVVFVDDLPPNHSSVAKHAPAVWRLHMVADPSLRALVPDTPDVHARIDTWADAESWISARLNGEPL